MLGSISDLLNKSIGVDTTCRINDLGATVGVTVTRVLRQDPSRLAATLVNLSANDIYILPDYSVSASKGIYLGPGGGSCSLLWSEVFAVVSYDWYAIASAPASSLLTIEQVLLARPLEN